jgi:glucose/arabinose dehydrogenase
MGLPNVPLGRPEIGSIPMVHHYPLPRVRTAVGRSARARTGAREVAVTAMAALLVFGAHAACTSGPTPHTTASTQAASLAPPTAEPINLSRPADPSHNGDESVSVSTLASKLDIPWGVTFLPDGAALVTERRTLRILKIGPEQQADGELAVAEVATITEANSDNEGGLLGIAASPNFARDQTVFVMYTTKVDNRIAKLRLGQRPQAIVTGIPLAGLHDGGRLMFGPDGYLYATTGDASRAENAQQVGELAGKVLRMTTEGKPPPGNPFPDSLVWSYGLRNPEGMAWDRDGNMFVAEIGEAAWDELNVIRPGENYGWPNVEGIGTKSEYINPIVAWRPEVGVSAGVAIQDGVAVVTCLRGQRIYLVNLTGSFVDGPSHQRVAEAFPDAPVRWRPDAGVADRPTEALTGKYGRLRTAINAPDGSIWLTTSNRDGRNHQGPSLEDDRILRLTLTRSTGAGGD